MTDLELKLVTALNTFCFQNIWNEPISELRNNIIPNMLQIRSVSGNIYYNGTTIPLPTNTDAYYVYAIPEKLLQIFTTRQVPLTWTDTATLCNDYNILLHTYHLSGKMLNKGYVHIRKYGAIYILAVNKLMASKCLKFNQMSDIRITAYFDSDLTNDITVNSYHTPILDDNFIYRQPIYQSIQNFPHSNQNTLVYVNGYERQFTGMSTLTTNSYIDVINDANNIFTFDLDLTDTDKNVGYYSERDQTYKQLIHIPKSLNPTNKVLTHNTADVFVRVKNSDGSVGKGVYLHRCAVRSVDQVTHNDISIPLFVLDSFRDYLGTQEISLHFVFRQHDKDNVLIRDKNYIDLLYTLDDATILDHLLGKIRSDLDFWKASHLESSQYVSMMFDIPNMISTTNMWKYIEGLGYYHTLALLCKQVVTSDILAWYDSGITYTKPYLFSDVPVYPFMYRNGKKIPDSMVEYANTDSLSLTVQIDASQGIVAGDKLTVDMVVDGNKNTYIFSPVIGNTQIEIPYSTFQVFEELSLEGYTVKCFDYVATKSYKQITNYTGHIVVTTTSTGVLLTFGPQMYGRTFVLQNKYRVFKFAKYFDDVLLAGDPIYLDLIDAARDAGTNVPVFYSSHTRVYMNGKYLIPEFDYTVQTFTDRDNNICWKQICVQNSEYLESSNNYLEWFVTSGIDENTTKGFVVDNMAAVKDQLALLFPEITLVHVDGLLELDPVDRGNYTLLPTGKYRQGAPYQICSTIPESISTFLKTYHSNDDLSRISILNDYFYGKQPILPRVVVLPKSHRCYSHYVVTVIRDLLNGTLSGISFDPDEDKMIVQFKDYLYLKDRDLVFADVYDLDLVDVYPHYKQLAVDDTDTYRILQEFITLSMPKDTVTSGEITYE